MRTFLTSLMILGSLGVYAQTGAAPAAGGGLGGVSTQGGGGLGGVNTQGGGGLGGVNSTTTTPAPASNLTTVPMSQFSTGGFNQTPNVQQEQAVPTVPSGRLPATVPATPGTTTPQGTSAPGVNNQPGMNSQPLPAPTGSFPPVTTPR